MSSHRTATTLAAYFAFCSFGCPSTREASKDRPAAAGRSATPPLAAGSKAVSDREDAGTPAAGSGGDCRGPGRNESGKEGDYRCPQAAFAREDTVRLAQLSGLPTSCSQADLLARFLPADAQNCGDLPLDASEEDRDQSYECARVALTDKRAFKLFWRVQGIDTVPHRGFIGRFDGDQRELFRLDVDADWFGIDIMGAVASWNRCEIPPTNVHCDLGPAECFGCSPIDDALTCGCLPEGPRPGGGTGSTVELRCKPYGT